MAKYVYIQICGDTAPEDPETVLLSIADGGFDYTVGSPGEAILTIIDDLPPGGTTINCSSSADGLIHTLTFTDNPRQTIQVPTAAVPSDRAHAANDLRILNPTGSQRDMSDWYRFMALVLASVSVEDEHCVSCLIAYAFFVVGAADCWEEDLDCGFDCIDTVDKIGQEEIPGAINRTRDLTSDFVTLQRYRDEVLPGSPGGGYYVQLYQDYSLAVGTAILQRPALIHRVADTWDLWLPAVAAEVDGQGASFTITSEMQTSLLDIMTEFEEVGSPALADLVAEFRTSLDLEHIAGTTASGLQDRIETSSMDAARASLGELKSMYR